MQPIQPGRPGRFSFVDEGEAVRRLNVGRETLLELVASKRLRAYPGVGKGNFFRVGDLFSLRLTSSELLVCLRSRCGKKSHLLL